MDTSQLLAITRHNLQLIVDKKVVITVFLAINCLKLTYALLDSNRNMHIIYAQCGALLFYVVVSFLALRNQRIPLYTIAASVFLSGLGNIVAGFMVSNDHLAIRVLFVTFGAYFSFSGPSIVLFRRGSKVASERGQRM